MSTAEKLITPPTLSSAPVVREIAELQTTGQLFYQRGWSLGTSSNYSVVLRRDPLHILITASGRDKRTLSAADFVIVNENAGPVAPEMPKPSAETHLHVLAAKHFGAGAVLHTHSVWATVLSDRFAKDGGLVIDGYEMLKGLSGIETHQTRYWLDIFENSQDIPALAAQVQKHFTSERPHRHGFLLRKHGLYTWGRDLNEARRHVEIFEFLFEAVGRALNLST